MEGLLTPVSTAYKTSQEAPEEFLVEVKQTVSTPAPETNRSPDTPEGILEILRHQPDFESLSSILPHLNSSDGLFDIKSPSPIAAQLVNVLVAEIIPSYWSILKSQPSGINKKSKAAGKEHEKLLLLECLRSVTGLNAILGRIRALFQEEKETKTNKDAVGLSGKFSVLRYYVEVVQEILEPDWVVKKFHTNIQRTIANSSRQAALWQEFVALICGGKILSNAAEAVAIINESSNKIEDRYWIADGALYCSWLGRNFCRWMRLIPAGEAPTWKNYTSLVSKSLRLGHTGKSNSTLRISYAK